MRDRDDYTFFNSTATLKSIIKFFCFGDKRHLRSSKVKLCCVGIFQKWLNAIF